MDDEEPMVLLLERFLKPIASLVDSTDNLQDALEMAKTGNYNAIIQDIRLAAKNDRPATGIEEALEAIREFKRLNAAVVVVSGLPDPTIKQAVMNAGADAFVAKDTDFNARAMLMATHIATLKLPASSYRSDSYLSHVQLLQNLVTPPEPKSD